MMRISSSIFFISLVSLASALSSSIACNSPPSSTTTTDTEDPTTDGSTTGNVTPGSATTTGSTTEGADGSSTTADSTTEGADGSSTTAGSTTEGADGSSTTGDGSVCGDGMVTGTEECDDQDTDNTDGCLETCQLPHSCLDIKTAVPSATSGNYTLETEGETFLAYCDMETDGGGWTVTMNLMWPPEGLVFTDDGTPGNPCYDQLCVPRAYSRVPITSDLMLDASDAPNTGATQSLRVRVTGVHASTVGQDTRTLLTTPGPWYVEAEDNSNLDVEFFGPMAGTTCDTPGWWPDFRGTVCDTPVITFYDEDGCGVNGMFQIGSSISYTEAHGNCAGWVANPNEGGFQWWPLAFRIWVR